MDKPKRRSRKRQVDRSATTMKSNEETVFMPATFARELIRQIVYNPQNTSSQKSYNYSIYTKENILRWLQNPLTNEKSLRDASNYMYIASMHYQRLISDYAGLLTGAYVVSPLAFEGKKNVKEEALKKQYYKVAKILETMEIPSTLRKIIAVCLKDGAYYGVRWSDKSSSFVQDIDPDYCKITSVTNGTFLFSVDMTKVQGKLEFYPAEFTKMYSDYVATGQKWQEVPSNISVCIKADDTIIGFTIPPFSAVLPSLYTIANAESLQETAEELNNYKMITGKVPIDDNGVPIIGWDLYQKYYAQLKGAIGDNVGLAITPFSLDTVAFEQKSGVTDVDTIGKAVTNFWSAAGTSGLLHGIPNSTAGVTKLSIKNDETFVMGIAKQYERVINRYLKTEISGNIKFKITILPITVYNQDEKVKLYKEASTFGLGKSYYAAATGVLPFDVSGLAYIEDNLLGFGEMKPMTSSYNTSAKTKEVGRPEEDEENLTEEGEKTRGNDTNANR